MNNAIHSCFAVCCVLIIVLPATPVPADETFASESATASGHQPTDWVQWRGAERQGHVMAAKDAPLQWSKDQSIRWRVAVAGRGHASATVLGDQVFLPTAVPKTQTQSVICFDRKTGKTLWNQKIHEGGFKSKWEREPNTKASMASSTIATDGTRLYVNFLNDNAVHTTALDLNGNLVWQQRICDYQVHQGYGSSPTLYESLVIVSADNKQGGSVVGLDRETGTIVWRHDRPKFPNYSSPIVLSVAGKDQLIMTGCELVTSLNPATGKVLWETEGATTECVTSPVTDGTLVFTSGGYPKNHIAAYAADGSAKLVWEQSLRAYVPSLLERNGMLYVVLDAGVAMCLKSSDGEVQWKKRLGGTFSSSPVLVGERIYATSEEGVTHVFKPDPTQFTRLAENQLGTSVFATPTFSGSHVFLRTAYYEGDERQEYLYCIE